MEFILPDGVCKVLNKLENAGAEAYVVGGSVRDMLAGKQPHDFDITTSATPDRVTEIFKGDRLIETGLKHGTVTVVIDKLSYEITTFRSDGAYSDGRRPDSVSFGTSISDDLARRDFTINAMAYHPKRGLIDPFFGRDDLREKIIRTVGDPAGRFSEDALRIMRGFRFRAVTGFCVEEKTGRAMNDLRDRLDLVANERIFTELRLALAGEYITEALLEFSPIIFHIIPELSSTYNFPQDTPYHKYDVWRHTAEAVGAAENIAEVRLAMLFHDAAKPACFSEKNGRAHFYGHAARSAEIAGRVLERLRCDSKTIRLVKTLIYYHDSRPSADETAIKRLLNKLGAENFSLLMKCCRADAEAKADFYREEQLAQIEEYEKIYEKIVAEGQCFNINSLSISGADLIACGVKEGPEVGKMLDKLLDLVIEGKVENDRQKLLEFAGKRLI